MKKIILLLGLAALCAGCSNKDSAKIDALNQKIDLLAYNQSVAISNEFLLSKEIQVLSNQLTNLPTVEQVNDLDFYYYTNLPSMKQIDSDAYYYHTNQVEKIAAFENYQSIMNDLLYSQINLVFTNTLNFAYPATPPNEDDVSRVLKIERESDIEQMQSDIVDIQDDLQKIKLRLGIAY